MNTNHLPQVVQELFKNVQAGGDISVGDITQVFQNVNNLNDWDKPLGFPHNIPNSNTQNFVGRENELVLIHQHLQTSNHAVISAVEGMGGIMTPILKDYYVTNLIKDMKKRTHFRNIRIFQNSRTNVVTLTRPIL